MELDEEIYVNIAELGGCSSIYQGLEQTVTKPVGTDAAAREKTETWKPFKVATVCLGLLSFLLLTTVVPVSVLYDRNLNQLSRKLTNQTAERDQLQVKYQNLTNVRDQLQKLFNNAMLELNNMKKNSGTCPPRWRQFGHSCYLFSTMNTWDNSRQLCLNEGAYLVTIETQEEMVFLNKLGNHLKFWIGLSKSSMYSNWKWTNGESLGTSYWQNGHPFHSSYRRQSCAAFNSFSTEFSGMMVRSWSSESCAQFLSYVCERQAETSHQSW